MLSLKRKSLELSRRSDVRLCMLYKQSNKLATYKCDKLQKNMRAECTPGSRLSVIDLSSHVVHVIITRTLFTLARMTIGQWNNLPLEIAMFI